MTTSHHHKLRVGVLAAVTGALVAIVVVVWGGFHLFRHRVRYAIELDGSVFGLSRGAEVFYNGISVGSVRSIEISPSDIRRVRIGIAIDKDTPVRADTKAT